MDKVNLEEAKMAMDGLWPLIEVEFLGIDLQYDSQYNIAFQRMEFGVLLTVSGKVYAYTQYIWAHLEQSHADRIIDRWPQSIIKAINRKLDELAKNERTSLEEA